MNKYILELREPAWRRYLRWTLWTLIAAFILATAWLGITTALRLAHDYQIKQSTRLLSSINPQLGVMLAEDFYHAKKTSANRLLYIRAAMQANAWDLADALLEKYRNANSGDVMAAAYDVITLSHVAPESMKQAILKLAALKPENDIEKLTFARAAAVSGDERLQDMSLRLLAQLAHSPLRVDSALTRTRLSLAQGNTDEAKERVLSLIDQDLNPTQVTELLGLLKQLQLREYDDYLSSLSLQMRGDTALSVQLVDFLWDIGTPQGLLDLIDNARPTVKQSSQIKIRQIALYQKLEKTDKALEVARSLSTPLAQETFTSLIEGKSPDFYRIKSKKDWVDMLIYAQCRQDPTLLKNITQAMLSEFGNSAWVAQANLQSALELQKTPAIAAAFKTLSARLDEANILKLRSEYWQLITQNETDTRTRYKNTKELFERYPERVDSRLSLGLAYFFAGSTTDALYVIAPNPSSMRERFLRGYVLAQAGQIANARRALANVDAESLTSTEQEFLKATQLKLQEDSPVQKLFEILQAPEEEE